MESTVTLRRDEIATISRLLLSAKIVVDRMNEDLTDMRKGRNLSSVECWQGQDFSETLKVYADDLAFLADPR